MTAQAAIPNTVRIFVGAGMSFDVPRSYYDEALLMATLQRKVWYVGLKRDGVEVGPIRADLLDKGCYCIGWIVPASKILASGVRP
jgi:hypothetical protein